MDDRENPYIFLIVHTSTFFFPFRTGNEFNTLTIFFNLGSASTSVYLLQIYKWYRNKSLQAYIEKSKAIRADASERTNGCSLFANPPMRKKQIDICLTILASPCLWIF